MFECLCDKFQDKGPATIALICRRSSKNVRTRISRETGCQNCVCASLEHNLKSPRVLTGIFFCLKHVCKRYSNEVHVLCLSQPARFNQKTSGTLKNAVLSVFPFCSNTCAVTILVQIPLHVTRLCQSKGNNRNKYLAVVLVEAVFVLITYHMDAAWPLTKPG